MIIGLVMALLAAVGFAAHNTFMRKGIHRSGEAFSPIPISTFMGTVLFTLPLFILGETGKLTSLSWVGVGSLAGAGVIHFVIGRILAYTSFQFIGVNRAAPIITCNTAIAALLGIFLLGEELTPLLILAFLLIIAGVFVISTANPSKTGKLDMPKGSLAKGVFAALGTAICWGTSPLLIKIGLAEANSPLLAVFVSYLASAVVAASLLFNPRNNKKLRRLDRTSLIPIIIAAVAVTVAQILRYTALDYSPISIVAPIMSIHVLFAFPLSFFINREIEAFGSRVIGGAITVVIGVFLMFWAA